MNRTQPTYLILFLLILSLAGCAEFKPAMEQVKLPSAISLAETYRVRAADAEKKNNPVQALYFCRIVKKINPADPEIAQKIKALQHKIEVESDRHFKRGLTFYSRSMKDQARKEFLTALRINPDHGGAKEYLMQKLEPETGRIYYTKGNETLAAIAAKMYNDPKKYFILAYLNNLDARATVPAGTRVVVPDIALATPSKPLINNVYEDSTVNSAPAEITYNLDTQIENAQQFLGGKKYDQALSLLKEILDVDPTNAVALEMENASYYQMGKNLELKKMYTDALNALLNVDSDYKDTKKSIDALKSVMKKEAENHYRRGVKYFVNEDLAHAISEWKATLALDPEHYKAKRDMQKAENILEQLKKIH